MDFTLAEGGGLPPREQLQSRGVGGKLLQFGGEAVKRSLAGAKIARRGIQLDGFEQGGHRGGSDIGAGAFDVMRQARAAWAVGLFHGLRELSINEVASSRISSASSMHTSRNRSKSRTAGAVWLGMMSTLLLRIPSMARTRAARLLEKNLSRAYQFVNDPSGRWNRGIGRVRSVTSSSSCSGLVSNSTPKPGRRLGQILPSWKS